MDYQSVELAYEEFGQGAPVVFLHGFPFDHTIWTPLVPHLQQRARLIMPDLRGHGNSPAPVGVYRMRDMAEDVVCLLDKLKIERAVLVGHSMGGYVSLAFAHAYPGRLAGLGLIATQAGADTPERRQARLRTASQVLRKGTKLVVNQMINRLTPDTRLLQPLAELMLRARPEGVAGSLRGMAERPNMEGVLSGIGVPAVVIAGDKDDLLPSEAMQTMAQMLPKGWLVEIAGAGHMLMMEAPDRVTEALGQLIDMTS